MRRPTSRIAAYFVVLLATVTAGLAGTSSAQELDGPGHLRDRGPGIPTSMFGTYVQRGDLLIYPFFEFYLNDDMEYSPAEFGHGLDEDFRGKFRGYEGLIFLAYGVTDRLAIELEAAVIDATLETAASDPSGTPDRIEESGLGDVEGQVRWRWTEEREGRPEVFSYFEAVAPVQREKLLIGTPDWEFKLGTGLVRGFSWGTVTLRMAGEYSVEESKLELGEYAVEYLKRLTPAWRGYVGIEGSQDEIELITEVQWHITDFLFVKFNNAFGVTSKANDWAPEAGLMLRFPIQKR
ncbi:MAG: hypothetical protein JSW03_00910 [Candidatus Eiseniibacteriota bacterium]|nr:MAG: hypothetical protein JSW03_00910 [Candidatus Eisenbacteria bacterium]